MESDHRNEECQVRIFFFFPFDATTSKYTDSGGRPAV
jgi:hypothetical protein